MLCSARREPWLWVLIWFWSQLWLVKSLTSWWSLHHSHWCHTSCKHIIGYIVSRICWSNNNSMLSFPCSRWFVGSGVQSNAFECHLFVTLSWSVHRWNMGHDPWRTWFSYVGDTGTAIFSSRLSTKVGPDKIDESWTSPDNHPLFASIDESWVRQIDECRTRQNKDHLFVDIVDYERFLAPLSGWRAPTLYIGLSQLGEKDISIETRKL